MTSPEVRKSDPPRQRVIAYIDGYNLYFGMREAGLNHLLWLDIAAMATRLLKPNQTLVGVKYFTARISSPPDSVRRQGTYIEAILTLPGVSVIEGRYEGGPDRCRSCGAPYVAHDEKMTDVNIAVELTKDAFGERFDVAILVTGDSDQVPSIRLVRELFPSKRVICAFPPHRKSKHLRAEAHGVVHVSEAVLRASQLAGIVVKPDGTPLGRPARWSASPGPGDSPAPRGDGR
jgi:hypothetical protein